ncbi:ATP-binding protein [Embleya sp. NPDC056575]|uniref:ATP-binding protein n=1 Tax=unclassified Embleya TaxID=2699296 RepID=UPI0036C97CAB
MLDDVVVRRQEETLRALLGEEPVIVLNGARTVGKSTLLSAIGARAHRKVLDFDDLATRDAVAADPALFAAEPSPVLVDEFQKVPELLDAIKAELNKDLRPGRFVLTGSTRYTALPSVAQSLTGRVHVVDVWPLSQGELAGTRETFCEQMLDDPVSLISRRQEGETRDGYEQRVLAGGFPLALRRSAAARSRWFRDYVSLVISRDVLEIRQVRQRDSLPRLLRVLAAQTGQVLNIRKAAEQSQLEPSVAGDYLTLLEAVFLLHRLPAWGRTLGSRVAGLPKIHLVDAGLASHLLGLTTRRLANREPVVLTEFGHVLETFVVGEVLRQAGWLDEPVLTGHFRTHDQVEVDLVMEAYDGRTAGIEVKSSSRVTQQDLRGLRMLRDKLGKAFTGGVLLNLGDRAYTIDERIHVLPVSRLWA